MGEAQRTSGAGHGLTDAEVELLFKVRHLPESASRSHAVSSACPRPMPRCSCLLACRSTFEAWQAGFRA